MPSIDLPNNWGKVEAVIEKLSYNHEVDIMQDIPDNKVKYAGSFELLDLDIIKEQVVKPIREEFDKITERLGINKDLSESASQDTWIWWDIGKQLYYDKNPEESKGYILGDPLSDKGIQSDIISRMLGYEISRIVNDNGNNIPFAESTRDFFLQLHIMNGGSTSGEDNHISSKTFTDLGKYIRNGGDKIINTSGGVRNAVDSLS